MIKKWIIIVGVVFSNIIQASDRSTLVVERVSSVSGDSSIRALNESDVLKIRSLAKLVGKNSEKELAEITDVLNNPAYTCFVVRESGKGSDFKSFFSYRLDGASEHGGIAVLLVPFGDNAIFRPLIEKVSCLGVMSLMYVQVKDNLLERDCLSKQGFEIAPVEGGGFWCTWSKS